MGGRGSSLIVKHIAGNDNKPGAVITLNDPESDIHNDMFKKLKENDISTRKSTDGIDDMVLKRQQEQIYNISSKYKKILNRTTQVNEIQFGAEKIKGRTLAYCESSFENGKISQRVVIDSQQFADYDKVVDTVTKGVKSGHFVPINTMFKSRDYLITHEFGHAVENGIIARNVEKDKVEKKDYLSYIHRLQTKIKREVEKIWKEKFTTGEKGDKIYLSKYSETNDAEWFAETFTNLELADEPTPIAKALKEYLRRNNL